MNGILAWLSELFRQFMHILVLYKEKTATSFTQSFKKHKSLNCVNYNNVVFVSFGLVLTEINSSISIITVTGLKIKSLCLKYRPINYL